MVTILMPQTKLSSPLLASMNDGLIMEPFQNITIVGWVSCGHPIDMFTQQDQHGVKINQTSIRRLTPVECMRLQGFPDNHNEFGLLDGKKVAISDTQRYKQAGNAVTVDVVAAVARKIKELL